MIFRTNTKINDGAEEVSFRISYSHVDCKRWLVQYVSLLRHCGIIDGENIFDFTSENESHLRHWLERELFKDFPQKYSEQLSRWAISTAIRKKYVSCSATSPTTLIFADSIIKKASD